jgi:hypothetical protein
MAAACPAHPILLYFVILVIPDEEYKLQISLCIGRILNHLMSYGSALDSGWCTACHEAYTNFVDDSANNVWIERK